MNNCQDLYVLSTLACKIAECVTEEELALLAIKFTTLGEKRHNRCFLVSVYNKP